MGFSTDGASPHTLLVEHYLPGLRVAELERFATQVGDAIRELEQQGKPLHFVRSVIIPGDESCLCIVEATSEALVREAYSRTGIAFERISLAIAQQS